MQHSGTRQAVARRHLNVLSGPLIVRDPSQMEDEIRLIANDFLMTGDFALAVHQVKVCADRLTQYRTPQRERMAEIILVLLGMEIASGGRY